MEGVCVSARACRVNEIKWFGTRRGEKFKGGWRDGGRWVTAEKRTEYSRTRKGREGREEERVESLKSRKAARKGGRSVIGREVLRLQTTCVSAAENVGEREKKRGRWSDADERNKTPGINATSSNNENYKLLTDLYANANGTTLIASLKEFQYVSPNVLRRDQVKRQLPLQFLRLVLSLLLLFFFLFPTVHHLLRVPPCPLPLSLVQLRP